jgi:hypothetical protein
MNRDERDPLLYAELYGKMAFHFPDMWEAFPVNSAQGQLFEYAREQGHFNLIHSRWDDWRSVMSEENVLN